MNICKTHKAGDIIKLAGIDFAVLADLGPSAGEGEAHDLFVLALESQGDSRFGGTNNYDGSDLAAAVDCWLNGLAEKGVDLDLVRPRTIDLMTLDCYKGYGSMTVKAAPLTIDEYRKYSEFIQNCDDAFWLATGWDRPEFGATYARYVYSNGFWDSRSCSYSYGIRPALVISSLLLVSAGKPDLSGASVEELVEELYRRTTHGGASQED